MLKFLTLTVLGMAVAATPAVAQTLIDGADAAQVLDLARGFGSAQLEADSDGDPKISGRIEGLAYSVWFYGCKDGRRCTSIQLSSAFDTQGVTLEKINDWNYNKRFSRAVLRPDGSSAIRLDVNLENGVTRANLDDTFSLWRLLLDQFAEHIGYSG